MMRHRPITVWAISDGRPGHWNQVCGLVEALGRLAPVRDYAVPAPSRLQSVADALTGRWRLTEPLPNPDLIVGAGHATHLPMLTAARSRGGRTVVLMRPTFPFGLFDACLIPGFQVQASHPNVITTRGTLNRMQPDSASDSETDEGIVLLGGPSRHVRWDSKHVLDQVFQICSRMGDIHWHISTSRRSPEHFAKELSGLGLMNATIRDGLKTPADWLPEQLPRSRVAWVTADSVSMVYESLTAGSSVGLISVGLRRRNGKIARNLQSLQEDGAVTLFEEWSRTGQLRPPQTNFNEARRCAALIVSQFFESPAQAA